MQESDDIAIVNVAECGHRVQTLYTRNRGPEGEPALQKTQFLYCPECNAVIKEEDLSINRLIRVIVKTDKLVHVVPGEAVGIGREKEYCIVVPKKLRLDRKADKHGLYKYSENDFLKLKESIEKAYGTELMEVFVKDHKGLLNFDTSFRFLPAGTKMPVKAKKGTYALSLEQYNKLAKAAFREKGGGTKKST